MKSTLNLKHKAFADEYVTNGFNGLQAYLKVYPTVTEASAGVNASRLLNNAKVKEYVLATQADTRAKSSITRDDIVRDLVKIKDLCFTDKRSVHNSIKALENLAKLLGLNEPEKLDIKAEIENKTLRDYLDFNE